MDQFGNILNTATNEANQTYATNTANATNTENQANAELNSVNAEGQNADQQAAKLSALGDTYSNQAQNEANFNQATQDQLNTMGFDKTTLNQADQNIAQETGQLGTANNQMAAEGGTRGFNAVGAANRQADVQGQFNNAIAGNTAVQSNELGKANTAATLTGQDMTYQLGQNTNSIDAYNSSAQQSNNTMANYASTLNTLATKAVQEGGLVGSNVANIMASANSAAQAALAPSQAQLNQAQAYQANTQGQVNVQTAANLKQQNLYNAQMQPLQIAAEKLVQSNQAAQAKQIATLETDLNYNQTLLSNNQAAEQSGNWTKYGYLFLGGAANSALTSKIASDQSQISNLQQQESSSAG